MTGPLLVLGDSLAFHGPDRPEPVHDLRLWPNVAAARLGTTARLVARMGWTARDAWWAVTKDPQVWSVDLPAAGAVVLAVGGMDQLPASIPSFLREGIAHVRPGSLRRRVRASYRALHPHVVRLTGGPFRMLPQAATDAYLTRLVQGVRHFRPDLPVVALTPSPWSSADYPARGNHPAAVVAARRWAAGASVPLVELDPIVGPALARGEGNPDGLHWGWTTHERVGVAVAAAVGVLTGR